MKKTISMLMAICIAFALFASFGRMQTPAEETQTTVPETAAQQTTSALPVMTPAEPFDAADRLEPTQADLERLGDLFLDSDFFYADYDSDSSCILDLLLYSGVLCAGTDAYDLLREDENYVSYDAAAADESSVGTDPRGLFPDGGYKKIRADVMEYYLENVFHNFSYPDAREKYASYTDGAGTQQPDCLYYYADGWYYLRMCPCNTETVQTVRGYETEQNGHYLLTVERVSAFEPDAVEGAIRVDATLTEKDGRRLWTIYGTTVTYNCYAEPNA